LARSVELRRHTDSDGDVLSDDGVAAALRLGGRLAGGYQVAGRPPSPAPVVDWLVRGGRTGPDVASLGGGGKLRSAEWPREPHVSAARRPIHRPRGVR
jgi:hypothetical protein